MLLRRLAESIRHHSWSTAVLEIAIVVVGIYLGLQADDWNQQRRDRDNDRRALALFVSELDSMLRSAANDLATTTATLHHLSDASRAAMNCDATAEDHVRLGSAVVAALDWRVPNIRPSGLAEISNSGTLERIGNLELSHAVGSVNEMMKFTDDSMDMVGPTYHQAVDMLLPFFEIVAPTVLVASDTGLTRMRLTESMALAPQQDICSSQDFLLGLTQLTAYYDSMAYVFDSWYRALERAQRLAARQLH